MERLKEKYQKEVAPALTEKFGYKNVMQLPKVEKVIINMGVGEAVGNPSQDRSPSSRVRRSRSLRGSSARACRSAAR